MYYVYSTLTADTTFAVYKQNPQGKSDREVPISVIERAITIKGGHGVATRHFVTPKGVCTTISDEEYGILQKDHLFNVHVDKGYLHVEKSQENTERIASDMAQRDNSAPLTPELCGVEESDEYSPEGKQISTFKKKKARK